MQSLPLMIALGCLVFSPQASRPIPARVRLEAGPRYAGQLLRLEVDVTAEGVRPEITPPRLQGGRLEPVGSAFQPLTTSAIGDLVNESNRYIFRYRLFVERPGLIVIPPFRVQSGNRSGASTPLQFEIRPLPPDRPPGFLGGVGPIRVVTEAVPAAVRVGETFEYRVRLDGPGAIGSTADPIDTARWAAPAIKPRVRPLPGGEPVFEPPSRQFRYQVRPERPGEVTLPPVVVSWFDPRTARYQTVVGAGVALRVVAVAEDAAAGRVDFAVDSRDDDDRLGAFCAILGLAITVALGIASACVRFRRFQIARRATPAACALHWAQRLEAVPSSAQSADAAAHLVADAFTAYLEIAHGVSPGTRSPGEIELILKQANGFDTIPDRARRLLERADRVRFAAIEPAQQDDPALLTDAREFFLELAGRCVANRPD